MENLTTLSSDSQLQSDRDNNSTLIFPKMKQIFDAAKIYDEAKIEK